MFLFWYLKKGFVIKKDYYITNKLKQYNFSSDRIEIYKCCELSNFITFIVVLISDNKIIASGAGINGDANSALEKALSEARLIEWQNKNNPMSNINNLTVEKNIEVINYINYLNGYLPNINFSSSSQKSLKIPNWISSFDVAVLNSMYDLESLTIKCISKDLFNCLPIKNNILLSLDKKIIQYYNVHISIINKTPDCILL
jgi:hypothetical protein